MSIYTNYYRRHHSFSYRAKSWIKNNSAREAKRIALIIIEIIMSAIWLGAIFVLPHIFH